MTTSAGNSIRCFVYYGLALFLGLPLLLVSCAPTIETGIVSFSGPTMGTAYKVSVAARASEKDWPPDVSEVQREVASRLEEINGLMSTYDSESELSRFNRSESTDWFSVSSETALVVSCAMEIAERTNGAFDPTVGPLVNLWGFGPTKDRDELPTEEAITLALEQTGYEQLAVRRDPPALRKVNPQIYVDLSAIAKGYAVDQISDLLTSKGIPSAMVDIGGEVRTTGTKPGEQPWRIAIEKPESPEDPFQGILEITNSSLATSGDYQNFFVKDGRRYSHTIDPQTGRPVQHRLAVVSVQADTCMEADALATALLVMGPERGYDWCEQHGVAALFQLREENGQIVTRSSSRYEELHRSVALADQGVAK